MGVLLGSRTNYPSYISCRFLFSYKLKALILIVGSLVSFLDRQHDPANHFQPYTVQVVFYV